MTFRLDPVAFRQELVDLSREKQEQDRRDVEKLIERMLFFEGKFMDCLTTYARDMAKKGYSSFVLNIGTQEPPVPVPYFNMVPGEKSSLGEGVLARLCYGIQEVIGVDAVVKPSVDEYLRLEITWDSDRHREGHGFDELPQTKKRSWVHSSSTGSSGAF